MTPTNIPETVERRFQREERYIVIKRKHLTAIQEMSIRAHMERLNIDSVECVVVESDWPEYETVWSMIEARVTGAPLSAPSPESGEAMREASDAIQRQLEALRLKNGYWPSYIKGWNSMLDRACEIALAALAPKPDEVAVPEGMVSKPFAYCCAEGGGDPASCDCVNKNHGTALFPAPKPSPDRVTGGTLPAGACSSEYLAGWADGQADLLTTDARLREENEALRALVVRARPNMPEYLDEWHADARAALGGETKA